MPNWTFELIKFDLEIAEALLELNKTFQFIFLRVILNYLR